MAIISDSTLYLKRGRSGENYYTNDQLTAAYSSSQFHFGFWGNGVTTHWGKHFGPLAKSFVKARGGEDSVLLIFWAGNDFDSWSTDLWADKERRTLFEQSTAQLLQLKSVFRDVFVCCPSCRGAWGSYRMDAPAITACVQAVDYLRQFFQNIPTDLLLHASEEHRSSHEQKRRGSKKCND